MCGGHAPRAAYEVSCGSGSASAKQPGAARNTARPASAGWLTSGANAMRTARSWAATDTCRTKGLGIKGRRAEHGQARQRRLVDLGRESDAHGEVLGGHRHLQDRCVQSAAHKALGAYPRFTFCSSIAACQRG